MGTRSDRQRELQLLADAAGRARGKAPREGTATDKLVGLLHERFEFNRRRQEVSIFEVDEPFRNLSRTARSDRHPHRELKAVYSE